MDLDRYEITEAGNVGCKRCGIITQVTPRSLGAIVALANLHEWMEHRTK